MVVNKTYIKIIFDEIKSSFGRFAAIFSIVALSIGFLSGLLVTTPDMIATVDSFYDENNAADINIKATMGLTSKDMASVRNIDGINEIMPAYVTDVMLDAGENVLNAKLFGLPLLNNNKKIINNLNLVEGRLIENENECLVEKGWGSVIDVELGTKLVVSKENEDYENINDTYNVLEYTVVGIVENSSYFSIEKERSSIGNGTANSLVYVDEKSYALDVYTDFFIKVKDAEKLIAFTDEYEDHVEKYVDILKELEKEQSAIRLADIKEEAYEKLNDARQEYEDAKKEAEDKLNDAAEKIADGKEKLKDAAIEIEDGKKELQDGKLTLQKEVDDANKEIADGYKELEDAKIELDDGEKEYADGLIDIAEGQKEYDDGLAEFLDGEQELIDAQAEFDEGEQEYLDGLEKLQDGKKELSKGSRQLAAAKEQLEQAEETYNKGYAEFTTQKTQFNELAKGIVYALSTSPTAITFSSTDDMFLALENDEVLKVIVTGILENMKGENPSIPADSKALIDAKNLIDEAEKKLKAGALEIQYGWEQYNSGLSKLRKGRQKIRDAEKELEEAKIELEENRTKLEDAWKELEDARLELEDGKKELDDGYKELADARIELDDGWIEYYDGIEEIKDAEETLKEETIKAEMEIRDGEIELADGIIEYEDGLRELNENEKKYLDAKEEAEEKLGDAEEKLNDAEYEIAKLENPQWYVLDRNSNVSYASFSANASKVGDVAKVFPIFFFLIAALVTLTTMTRMVEEERTQIGTLKALGYKKSLIVSKYLIYSGLASVLGSIGGVLIGFRLLPLVIWNAYRSMYNLPDLTNQFLWQYAIPEALLIIILTMTVTLYVTMSSLKEKPSTLMLPKVPKAGKRIFLENIEFIWSRMKFTHKSTARNILRYKRHLFMTVIGISGCTALLVTGFGLLDSINSIANTQFNEIFKYNLNVELEENKEYDEILLNFLNNKNVKSYAEIYSENGYVHHGNERIITSIKVLKDAENLKSVIDLRDRVTGESIDFYSSSVVISEKLKETLGIDIGDSITLENGDGFTKEFKVTGATENYVGTYLYMNKQDYEKAYYKNAEINTILMNVNYTSQEEYISDLLKSDTVMNVEPVTQIKTSFDNLLSTIEYIVIVIIAASGALAVIVLYNLTNININERRKELSTLKVLGYHNQEVASYVFRETLILSILGTLLGLPLGVMLHKFVIKTVEAVNLMMGRTISLKSFALSATITLFFSILVNMMLYKKLKRIEMVESMKAID